MQTTSGGDVIVAITEEQVMQVLGRSPAASKPNVKEVVAHYVGEANERSINDKSRIHLTVTKVIRCLITIEDCVVEGSSTRSGLNPPISYSISSRKFGHSDRTSHRERID